MSTSKDLTHSNCQKQDMTGQHKCPWKSPSQKTASLPMVVSLDSRIRSTITNSHSSSGLKSFLICDVLRWGIV